VDPYTEELIQKALREEIRKRTVIIVTHRVSTVRDADRIIVLDQGEIKAIGSHERLLNESPIYRRICEMQLVSIQIS
jgi:ABC-type multidrug transport system fused ATPase/permease subunit